MKQSLRLALLAASAASARPGPQSDVLKQYDASNSAASAIVPPAPASIQPSGAALISPTPLSKSALTPGVVTNEEQVGNSTWGSLDQPQFPKWIYDNDGKILSQPPWGSKTPQDADATVPSDVPDTGVTRYYNLTVSRGQFSPDGVLRDMIVINGQYPAPIIEANWGDWIEVTVTNAITEPEEGTALHWHGMLQRGTPWQDGTPSVSQCPIAPGQTYTYRFQAEQYGSSMYHAHYSAQYTGGAIGPMQIYGPVQTDYDIDLGPVMLSDWNHIPYFSMVSNIVGNELLSKPPFPDNALINGRSWYNCSQPSYDNSTDWLGTNIASDLAWTCVEGAPLSKFQFQSGKVHRLRLMNVGADGFHKFSIDGHTMTVIAQDYVPTQPFETEVVTLGVGQRTDVLVTAKGDSQDAVWMRTQMIDAAFCGGLTPPYVNFRYSQAGIYYEDADTTLLPTSTSDIDIPLVCDNDDLSLTQPEYVIAPTTSDAYYQGLTLSLEPNATGSFIWEINEQTYRADFNSPILFAAQAGEVDFPANPEWNTYNFAQNNSIVFNVTNTTPFPHPLHLHGHNFYVLAVGTAGTVWDGSIENPSNPNRRDTQIVPAGGYVAVQFDADNPGVWPFHCHVAWHLSGGLAINTITKADELASLIPADEQAKTCDAWQAWSSNNVVDQIDSGS